MTPEQKAAYITAQAAALTAAVAGMQARNQLNGLLGEMPTYLEADFANVVTLYECHHGQLCQLFHEHGAVG